MALLFLGVVRLLSEWSITRSDSDNGKDDRRYIMRVSMLKKFYNKVVALRSRCSGRKLWQYVMESMWAYGAV